MRRSITLLTILSLATMLSTMGQWADAQAGKAPTIKEIMKKLHAGVGSPLVAVRTDLQAEQPDWAEIQRLSKNFVTLGAALGKNDPPKGDKVSWAKLTGQYLQDARTLADAAEKKDKKTAIDAQTRMTGSCKGCHSVHRPN